MILAKVSSCLCRKRRKGLCKSLLQVFSFTVVPAAAAVSANQSPLIGRREIHRRQPIEWTVQDNFFTWMRTALFALQRQPPNVRANGWQSGALTMHSLPCVDRYWKSKVAMLYDYPSPMCQAGEMVTGSSGDDGGGSESNDRLHSVSSLISDCSLTTHLRPYNLPVAIFHCQMTLYGLI